MSNTTSPESIAEQVSYYYSLIAASIDSTPSTIRALCKALGLHIEDYISGRLSQSLQDIYVLSHFNEAVEHYNVEYHKRSKVVYIVCCLYIAITSILFVFFIKHDHFKKGGVYCTSLLVIVAIAITFGFSAQIVAHKFHCSAGYFVLNWIIYFWGTASVFRCLALVIRSQIAALHNEGAQDVETNFWVRLARMRLNSDFFVFKWIMYFSWISLIPGIVVFAEHHTTTFMPKLAICATPPVQYLFCSIVMFLASIAFIVLLYCLRNVVSDIYHVRYQLIAYAIVCTTLGIATGIIVIAPSTVGMSISTGYFGTIYLLLILSCLMATINITYPLCLILRQRLKQKSLKRKMKRRDLVSFAKVIMDETLFQAFCDFSRCCFTVENTYFIRRYIMLLDCIRQNGRVFCTMPSDESYAFHGTAVPPVMEKIKVPTTFSSRYQLLFTYHLPLESVLIFDVEPAEREAEILNEMYDEFFSDNAPYALNLPSHVLKRIRARYESKELSILMLEEAKNAVLTMLYENTFVKFLEQQSMSNIDVNGNRGSYDSSGYYIKQKSEPNIYRLPSSPALVRSASITDHMNFTG